MFQRLIAKCPQQGTAGNFSVPYAVLATLALAMATSAHAQDDLLPVPRPDLSAMEPLIRHEIAGLRANVDEILAMETLAAKRAEASGRLAEVYHAHAFHLAAEASYRNERRMAPQDPRWAYDLGLLYQDLGRLEEALAQLDAVLAAEPADLPSLIRSGDLELRLDRPQAARQFFERALATAPESAAVHDGLGRAASAAGDDAQAAQHFERALAIQPLPSATHYALALAYRRQGNLERARHHLELRAEHRITFPDPRLDALAKIPKISAANVILAQAAAPEAIPVEELSRFALAHLGETPGAIELLTAAVRQRKAEASPESALELARIHHVIAGLWIHRQADAEAIDHLQTALQLAPGSLPSRLELASALAREGQGRDAVEHYGQVLAVDPHQAAALKGRAATWIALGQDARAVADFRRLLEIETDRGEPRLHLAMVLQRLGQIEQAETFYGAALELGLDADDEVIARANLANLYKRRRELDTALQHLEMARRLAPENRALELQLADALGQLDRFDEAAGHYAHVVAAEPTNEAARRGEISALIFSRSYETARARLEDGHRALPESRVLSHLLSRFLAVAPLESLRDGERALALAREVFAQRQTLLHGETVAMALAETGRFQEAAELQGSLLEAARRQNATRTVDRLQANLERYRAGQPCCVQQDFVVLLPTTEPGA